MSNLLIQWVNEDVGLSQEVSSLDEDFRDGYLLGELLSKYRQQSDFSAFSPKGTNDAKINNFKRLEPTMRTLGLQHFNSRVANHIMEGKPGVMKSLLFELKTTLDSYHRGVRRPTDKKLVQVIAIEKPKYNKTMAETFENGIRTAIIRTSGNSRTAGTVSADSLASKNEEFHSALEAVHGRDLETFVSDVQRAKQISQQRKLHERDFMKAWDEKNTKQWKVNLARGKARRDKERDETFQRTQTIQSARFHSSQEHRQSALVGIGQFEETLKRELLKNDATDEAGSATAASMFMIAGGQPGTGVPTLTYMNPETLRDGLVQTQKTLKERHDDMVTKQQIQMRRRKRYVREKEAHQAKQLHGGVESDIADQLLSMNKSEEIERLARSRVLMHSNLMKENARNRANRAASLTAEFTEKERVWKQLQANREVQWVIQPRIAAQRERHAQLCAAGSAAASRDTHDFITSIIDRVLDTTDWVVCCRLLGSFSTVDDNVLPAALWADAMAMCAEASLPIPPSLPLPEPCNVFDNLPFKNCARPLCSDQDWIAMSPFTGSAIMSLDPATSDDRVAVALSRRDAGEFIAAVASARFDGGDVMVPSKEPVFNNLSEPVAEEKSTKDGKGGKKAAKEEPLEEAPAVTPYIGKTKTLVENPDWLFAAPVKNLLGGVLVECRNAASPLPSITVMQADVAPEERQFFPMPPKPSVLRIAVCGPADSLKRKLAAAISRQLAPMEMNAINMHDLVQSLTIVELENPNGVMPMLLEEVAESLRQKIFADVCEGGLMTDSTYVAIACAAIDALPPTSGYILEDFPRTAEQARLLLLSLTGVDRAHKKPQPNEKASEFALVKDAEFVDYDKSMAVFDAVIHVTAESPADPYEYRVRCRRDLRDGSTVVVSDDCPSVEALSEEFTPDRPVELLSVALQLSLDEHKELVSFLSDLNILKSSSIASHSDDAIDIAAAALLTELPCKSSPAEVQPPENLILEGNDVSQSIAAPVESAEAGAADVPVDSPKPPELTVTRLMGTIHVQVAKALVSLWDTAERQSRSETESFFQTVRDVRYRMVQRRRCFTDALAKCSNKRDAKQSLWEKFVENFNSFDDDFRYDPDLKAELHLRALELRAAFWALAEVRRKDIDEVRAKILADGALEVAVHCIQGSAASLVQSEVNRFKTGMNIIQDYLKSVSAYKYSSIAFNALEECAAPPNDMYEVSASGASLGATTGKDGKPVSKPKGGKSEIKTLRNAIAPILLDKTTMIRLPEPAPLEQKQDEAAGKGKAAAVKKVGKGKEEVSAIVSPLAAVELSAMALADYYSQGTFMASRDGYEGNECMVEVMESAIWYEAARLKFAVARVKSIAVDIEAWLMQYEQEAGQLAELFIRERYLRELACSQVVVARVIRAVEDFSPIREQWLLANDAVSVISSNLILPLPAVPPTPEVAVFPINRFNEEQLNAVGDALSRLQLGGLVLLEDVEMWLQKASLPGAAPGNTVTSDGAGGFRTNLYTLSLPSGLVDHQDAVSAALQREMIETQFLDSGVCPAAIVQKTMAELVIHVHEPPEPDSRVQPEDESYPPPVDSTLTEEIGSL